MRLIWISLLVFLMGSSLCAAYLLKIEHGKEEQLLRSALSDGVEHRLDLALRNSSENFGTFVKDFGGWELVNEFVGHPDKGWADANIGAAAAKKGIDQVWLYNDKFQVVYSFSANDQAELPEVPLAKSDIQSLVAKQFPVSFFIGGLGGDQSGPLEVFAGNIEPASSAGKVAKPFGYIFAARRWTVASLKELSKNTNTLVSIEPEGWSVVPDAMSSVTFFRPLPGWNGEPAFTLRATKGTEILEAFEHLRERMINICIGYGLIVLVASLLLALHFVRQAPKVETLRS